MTDRELMLKAIEARDFAYVPYSHYKVGAALLAKNGRIYTGCNIENSAFSPTICAERTAVFKAVSEGVTEFEKIAVVGGEKELSCDCTPCGVCRQVLSEFCSKDFKIILGKPDALKVVTLDNLLPYAFKKD